MLSVFSLPHGFSYVYNVKSFFLLFGNKFLNRWTKCPKKRVNSKIRAKLRQFEKLMLCKIDFILYVAVSIVIITLPCFSFFLPCALTPAKEWE